MSAGKIWDFAVCIGLFWLGGKIFNHFSFPAAGIAVACAYPLWLFFKYVVRR